MVVDQFGIKQIYRSSTIKQKSIILPMKLNQLDTNYLLRNLNWLGTLAAVSDPSETDILYYEFQNFGNFILLQFKSQPDITPSSKCNLDHTVAGNQGFAYSVDDWQNVEITGHFMMTRHPEPPESPESIGTIEIQARTAPSSSSSSSCCSATGYGANLQRSNFGERDGLVTLFKFANRAVVKGLPEIKVNDIVGHFDFMWQRWLGVKLIVRNVEVLGQVEVHVELWLSPSDESKDLENWILVYQQIDTRDRKWTNIGTACNSPHPNEPITFGSFFCSIAGGLLTHFRFKNLSIREIESFEEQVENPPGGSDPGGGSGGGGGGGDTNPPPDPEPPSDPEPPDVPTPPTPTIIQKRLTIKREIINNAFCQCDGIPDTGSPGGGGGGGGSGGGGGGGGTGSLRTIYNVSTSGAGYAKLASVSKNRDEFYLRYGQIADQSDSVFIGEKIGRIEIFIAEEDKPRGGTGNGVHCRIRRGTNDSIAVDFGTAREEDIHDAGSLFKFQKLDNTYAMAINDKILFEYDGGGSSDYVKIFRKSGQPDTGSKTVHRNNNQDPGEYSTSARDLCMKVFAVAGTLNSDTSDT